jgi:hypothetical protein
MAGDIIRFARQLDGNTIALTQGQLAITENLAVFLVFFVVKNSSPPEDRATRNGYGERCNP